MKYDLSNRLSPVGTDIEIMMLQGPELQLPIDMEVVYLPYLRGGTYPGLFIYTDSARMMRAVIHLPTNSQVMIGSLEQHNLSIR